LNRLVHKLAEGDMRSKGRSEQIVKEVLIKPTLFPELIDALDTGHPGVRMRASDAIEKITRQRPELLQPFKQKILRLLTGSDQQEVRWHLAQIVSRLSLTPKEREKSFSVLEAYLKDKSSIVRTFAMQAMADLAESDPAYRSRAVRVMKTALKSGTPAMQSRARKLLAQINKIQ
jgi:predicted thioredoxin/glutaredoxin